MSKTTQRPVPAQMPPDPLTPYPVLPLPKRPATKPDVVRKPPAVTPEENTSGVTSSDKTGHYSNITPIKTTKNPASLPLELTNLSQASMPATSSQKASQPISPPVLSPITGNLSTNPFLDLIQAEDSVKSITQSFSGKEVSLGNSMYA